MEKCYSEVELNQENLIYNTAIEQELWKEEEKDRYPRIEIDLQY